MALTSAQKTKIRLYLGWPARFHQTDSRLEMAMTAVESDADAVTEITTLLTNLAATDTELHDMHTRLKAVKLGSIELDGVKELGALRSEGRKHAGRLAALLGVNVRHDVFSGKGPQYFSGWYGPYDGGSGNLPPLG